MAKINRSDVIQKAVNELAISIANDKVPTETLDKVQLTYNLNETYSSFVAHNGQASTGTLTVALPTIESRNEIYLTSVDFHIIKDAANDCATSDATINCTPFYHGSVKSIAGVSLITLTAQEQHIHIDFSYPLKLKPNSTLYTASTFGAGVMRRFLSCTGFIVSSN